MNNRWLLSVVALLSIGTATCSQAQAAGNQAEKAVATLENQWLQSEVMNDPDSIAPFLAAKYASTSPDGQVEDKAQTIAELRNEKFSSGEYENVTVTAFGTTVIAMGGWRGKWTQSGKSFEGHLRWTDTWVRMGGKWQCIASHYSTVKG